MFNDNARGSTHACSRRGSRNLPATQIKSPVI